MKNFFSRFKKRDNYEACEDRVTLFDVFAVLTTQLIIFLVIIFCIWGSQKLYTKLDPAVFTNTYALQASADSTEEEKGVELLNSITNQIKYELDSPFGWTANDILFNKYILDNRAYRQYGVYNATKTIVDFYSTDLAKLGNADKENDDLYAARMNHFALSPSRWGVLFIPSAESNYNKGLELVEKYQNDLMAGNAIYNLRSDDIHKALDLIVGDKLLGYAIGLLQAEAVEEESFTEIDNKIYEAQGMALVVRDFFVALYQLYPDIADKNNKQNYDRAMSYLNAICEYDPLVMTKSFNSTELIISYLLFARSRIEDIKESIRI